MKGGMRFVIDGIRYQKASAGSMYAWNLTNPLPDNKLNELTEEQYSKALVVPFDKVTYIATTCGMYGSWGKGDTALQALDQVKKSGAKAGDPIMIKVVEYYSDQDSPWVGDCGGISYHGSCENLFDEPVCIKRFKKAKK